MAVKSMRNSTVYLGKDATSKGSAMLLKVGQGTFSWTEAQTIEYEPDQGKIGASDGGTAVQGEDVPMAVSFDCRLEYYLDATIDSVVFNSPVDLLQDTTRATGDGCGPASIHIWLDTTVDCESGTEIESLLFPRFRWESLNFDTDEGRLSVSGNCLAIEPILYDRT